VIIDSIPFHIEAEVDWSYNWDSGGWTHKCWKSSFLYLKLLNSKPWCLQTLLRLWKQWQIYCWKLGFTVLLP